MAIKSNSYSVQIKIYVNTATTLSNSYHNLLQLYLYEANTHDALSKLDDCASFRFPRKPPIWLSPSTVFLRARASF